MEMGGKAPHERSWETRNFSPYRYGDGEVSLDRKFSIDIPRDRVQSYKL
jgi:hypothetical protein